MSEANALNHEHKKPLRDRIEELIVAIAVGMTFYLFLTHLFSPGLDHSTPYVVYDAHIVSTVDADTGIAADNAGNKFFILGTIDELDLRVHQESQELTLSCSLFGQSNENLILEDCEVVED